MVRRQEASDPHCQFFTPGLVSSQCKEDFNINQEPLHTIPARAIPDASGGL